MLNSKIIWELESILVLCRNRDLKSCCLPVADVIETARTFYEISPNLNTSSKVKIINTCLNNIVRSNKTCLVLFIELTYKKTQVLISQTKSDFLFALKSTFYIYACIHIFVRTHSSWDMSENMTHFISLQTYSFPYKMTWL